MNTRTHLSLIFGTLMVCTSMGNPSALAAPVFISNHSFEADANTFNEFFLGVPAGWDLYDPMAINGGGDLPGTLTVTGSAFFNTGAPDGDNAALLFIEEDTGGGEFGLAQTLSAVLEADRLYTLSVAVGNIQSGNATNNQFFDLSGFPGYRLEILAGGTLLASLEEGIDAPIAEGEFVERSLGFSTDASHTALLGQALQIRLINTNLTDPLFPGADLEVDFDNVRLDVVPVPLPAALPLLLFALLGLGCRSRTGNR